MTMRTKENERAAKVLDEIEANIAVLDQQGVIVATNRAWREFAAGNRLPDGTLPESTDVGSNYLDVCRTASGVAAETALSVHDGIRAVLDGRQNSFRQEYPCHGPDVQRWYRIKVKPIKRSSPREVVVVHTDITAQYAKDIELQIRQRELANALVELQAMAMKIATSMAFEHPSKPAEPNAWYIASHNARLKDRLKLLSRREKEVFAAIVRGERNTQIAERLQISNKSVSTYRTRVLEKLQVENNAQLVTLSAQIELAPESSSLPTD